MELYLDTANIEEIREIVRWGVLAGVTTNPTLVAKSGRDLKAVIVEIAETVKGPVSAEVISTDAEGMIREAHELARLSGYVVIKVPMTPEGLAATRVLADEGIPVNVTLVFSPTQALLAARAGARYVSPFVGRVDDISWDGIALIEKISEIFQIHDLPTKIIAASIRHPRHVVDAALAGADIATVPYKVMKQMVEHPLTDKGIERFLADWRQAQSDLRG